MRVMAVPGVALLLELSLVACDSGPAQASGGAHADDGQLWIADHYEEPQGWRAVLYRIPLEDR